MNCVFSIRFYGLTPPTVHAYEPAEDAFDLYDTFTPVLDHRWLTVDKGLDEHTGFETGASLFWRPRDDFYFADGNGNVTALVDTNQTLSASYRYDPFGNTISQSGVLADANVYRFSSKEIHASSGMYYYLYRFYDLGLQRWINRDPIGEEGGANLYGYAENAPIGKVDSLGLTCASNWKFFWSWAMGGGKADRFYGPNTTETKEMENSPGGNKLRNAFYNNGCKDVRNFGYGTGEAAADTLLSPSDTCWQVGGFGGATAIDNGNGTVTFTIKNVAGTHSFFYHILPNVPSQINLPIAGPVNTPGRNINQTFQWSEPIDKSRCKCPKK